MKVYRHGLISLIAATIAAIFAIAYIVTPIWWLIIPMVLASMVAGYFVASVFQES